VFLIISFSSPPQVDLSEKRTKLFLELIELKTKKYGKHMFPINLIVIKQKEYFREKNN